jgi:hypothetical protein
MRAVPIMAASATLFVLAALTEGFLSPSPAPYLFKAAWAILSSGAISFYFVVLGFPRESLSRSVPGHRSGDGFGDGPWTTPTEAGDAA